MQEKINQTEHEPAGFKPVKVLEVEISQPLPEISAVDEQGEQVYQRALVLVRLHSIPLGTISIDFNERWITAAQLAGQVWAKFKDSIIQHLQQDGLETRSDLPESGLGEGEHFKCITPRHELVAEAPMISIVISTRDRVESLAKTLNSLLTLNYPRFEVVLIDNAPKTDETHKYFNFIQPRFLRNNISLRYVREDTPGLALAHNRGLEFVRSPIVAFTDDDVVVDRYWLIELLRGFKAAPLVGCVTGLVVPVELETPAQIIFEEYGGFVKGFDQKIYDLEKYRPTHPLYPYSPGHFGTGANMAYRTDFLKKVGGFDPALGIGTPSLGADDLVAFFQTIISGYQLVYQPSALVLHQHRRSYESLKKQMYGYGTGLTAFLVRCVLEDPKRIMDILSRVPIGLNYTFAPGSPKNSLKSSDYPRELEWIERKGMLYGPIAYLISRWRYRNHKSSYMDERSAIDPSQPQHYLVTGWVEDYQGDKRTKEL